MNNYYGFSVIVAIKFNRVTRLLMSVVMMTCVVSGRGLTCVEFDFKDRDMIILEVV